MNKKPACKIKKFFTFVYLLVLGLILISSCKKQMGFEWQTDISIPVAKTSITISNLLASSYIGETKKPITLIYNQTLFETKDSELIIIPDTILSSSFSLPFGSITLFPNQLISQTDQEINLTTGNSKLSNLVLKKGQLKLRIISRILEPISIKYIIPPAQYNNKTLEVNTNVKGAFSIDSPAISEVTIDLSGYSIDLTGKLHNSLNKLFSNLLLTLSADADQTVINPLNKIEFEAAFTDLVPSYAKGDFGMSDVDNQNTINLHIFDMIKSGSIHFTDISSKIEIENGVGADAKVKLEKLEGFGKNMSVLLSSNQLSKFININRASDNPYKKALKSIELNQSNSNIKEFIENMPNRINYSYFIGINPLGNISNGNDFVYTDRLIKVRLNLEIPLRTSTNHLILEDTVTLHIDSIRDIGLINSKLKFIAKNYFDNEITIRVYALNSDMTKNIEITKNQSILPQSKDAHDQIIEAAISKETLDLLVNTKKILVQLEINSNGQFVDITNESRLDLKLSVDLRKNNRAL